MKKRFTFLVFVVSVFAHSVSGQSPANRWGMGVVVGSPFTGRTALQEQLGPASGLILGLDARYRLGPTDTGWSLHLQPFWSRFNQSHSVNSPQYQLVTTWRQEAVTIPLLIRHTFATGRIRPFVEAGPYLKIRTKLNLVKSGHSCYITNCRTIEETSVLHPLTTQDRVGVLVSAGAEVSIWNVTVPVSIRWNEGADTFRMKESTPNELSHKKLKTSSFEIVTGVSF